MLSQKTNTQANNCKSLYIHRKAKESSAERLDTYFFIIKTKHKSCFTLPCFTFFSIRLPVLQWMMPCLWSGQCSHVLWSGLAAARELDCVAMNGGGGAKPDLSARLASVQRFMVWDEVRQATPQVCFVCVFLCVMLFKLRPSGVQSWWYGRLGKQEIVGPSRLILPTLPLSWLSTASCCGHGMAASEARWRACGHVCVCVFSTNHMKEERSDGSCGTGQPLRLCHIDQISFLINYLNSHIPDHTEV